MSVDTTECHSMAWKVVNMSCHCLSFQADLFSDAYAWPLVAGMSCGLVLYACSSAAHWFQSRSELAHYVAFTFDYAGIGLYGLGSVVMHLHYCSEPVFYDAVEWFFIPAGCVLAFLICLCCSVSKVRYQRPYPFIRKACCSSALYRQGLWILLAEVTLKICQGRWRFSFVMRCDVSLSHECLT